MQKMQKIASYNGKLMNLVLLEEHVAARNGLQVWECSCGSKFVTVFYASYHCEKNHKGDTFEDRIKMRNDFPKDTLRWNTFYSAVTDIILKTKSTDYEELTSTEQETVINDKENANKTDNENVERNPRKREASDSLSDHSVEAKSAKISNNDVCLQHEESATLVQEEIETCSNESKSSDEEKTPEHETTDSEQINKISDVSLGYPKLNFATLTTKMIERSDLPFPIPDPNFYPYPYFDLAYDSKLLFLKDGKTATAFLWRKRAEYYKDIRDRKLDPRKAREQWMQRHAPTNPIYCSVPEISMMNEPTKSATNSALLKQIGKNKENTNTAEKEPIELNHRERETYASSSDHTVEANTSKVKENEGKANHTQSEDVERQSRKSEASYDHIDHTFEARTCNISNNDAFLQQEESVTLVQEEIETSSNESKTSDEDNNLENETIYTEITSKIDDVSSGYPKLNFLAPTTAKMMSRPDLPFPIPDPGSYPYPYFTLAYDSKLLFLKDKITATSFHWRKMAEYYKDLKERKLDPWKAREQWMQRHAPTNGFYTYVSDISLQSELATPKTINTELEKIEKVKEKINTTEIENFELNDRKRKASDNLSDHTNAAHPTKVRQNKQKTNTTKNKNVGRDSRRKKDSQCLMDHAVEANTAKIPSDDACLQNEESTTLVEEEIQTTTNKSVPSNENRTHEYDPLDTQQVNKIEDVSLGYPKLNFTTPSAATMISRPELSFSIADPNSYPYPLFVLAYDWKLLFLKDGRTATAFHWRKMAEYYKDVRDRKLDPYKARQQWMQRHAPTNPIYTVVPETNLTIEPTKPKSTNYKLQKIEKDEEKSNKNNENVERKPRKRETVDTMSDIVIEAKSAKMSTDDIGLQNEQSTTIFQEEIETSSEESEHSDEVKRPKFAIEDTEKINEISDISLRYPQLKDSFPHLTTPTMITRPELPFSIPDPESYPYPYFVLAYDSKLLYLKDEKTVTKFHWLKMAEYYKDVKERKVDPWAAREQWMQRHVPTNPLYYGQL